ncbi:MAG: hypothetical protein M0Z50_03195 [Planctomycetia bacterium]|nr:hypothetical protein [Planctomycetia bacterium]
MQLRKVIYTVAAIVLVIGAGFSSTAFSATDLPYSGLSKTLEAKDCLYANKVYSVGSTLHKEKLKCHVAGEPLGDPTVAYWTKAK